ncbi:MAG: undecaprenyl/decaprenyl-phosphate alpha-N-acetylglucosaminyl 1-phosphate transferase [Chloroflexi bacterium]|nr:MAG: undecaprenyl/decaprenyl-phosphate alpha-N-acetylglucosaminyl 1-phosphate transferase [Chloroflexota bacterium]
MLSAHVFAATSTSPDTDFFSVDSLIAIRDHLLPGIWPMLFAFAICAVLVPPMIWVSRRAGVMAHPSERHPHSRPMPLLGGLAMFVGFGAAMLLFMSQADPGDRPGIIGVLAVSGLAAVLLIVDDRWSMPPLLKFGLQLAIALIAVVGLGKAFQITFVSVLGGHIVQLGLLAIPISLFWMLGMQNTVNLLDGVDGLASGVVMIVAVTLMFAAAGNHQPQVVQLAGALAGACGGFLLFNFSPARIFMHPGPRPADRGHRLGHRQARSYQGVGGDSGPQTHPPPAAGLRPERPPDVRGVLQRQRPAGGGRADDLRPPAHPRGGAGDIPHHRVDRRRRPAQEVDLAARASVPAPPAG